MSEIRKVYLAHFLAGLTNAASVTFTLYFLSHGLQQEEIGQLFAVFMITLALLEIPTGGLADMFGHKASVVAGLGMQAISFLLFFLYPNYAGFLLGMVASALGLSFQSGAMSSLIYELLHKETLHENFQKVIGRANGYFLVASIIASPIGSLVYKHHPSLPYFFAFLCFLIAACVLYLVKWEFTKKPHTFVSYAHILAEGVMVTVKNRVLMATVIIGIALTVNRMVFNQNISQPYLLSAGVDVGYIGFIAAAVSALQVFISINAYKISRRIGNHLSLFLTIAVPGVSVLMLSMINSLLAIPFILMLSMGHAFRDPILAHVTQNEVERDKRSTMASTVSFFTSITVGLLLPQWGSSIDAFGLHASLFYLGVFSLVVGSTGLLLYRYGNKR